MCGRRRIQPFDLLPRQPQALHQFDVAQRFRGRSRESRGLFDDHLLHFLDLPAQYGAQPAEQRHRQQVGRCHRPVNLRCIDHHEHQADERSENQIDRRGDELLHIGADLLQLAQRLAAALVFEEGVRQFQRMTDAVGVNARTHLLCDQVHEIILKVLCDPGNERDSDCSREQPANALDEFRLGQLGETGNIAVNNAAEDIRVEKRKHLVDRREDQRQDHQGPVLPEVGIKKFHTTNLPNNSREAHPN